VIVSVITGNQGYIIWSKNLYTYKYSFFIFTRHLKGKMKKALLALLLAAASFAPSRAQNFIDFSPAWIDTNLFHSIHLTFVGDMFNFPVVVETVPGSIPPATRLRQSFGIGLASFAYEPRLNIYNYYDYISVSVSAPVTVSFSAIDGDVSGVGHVHFPLMVEGNFFGQSVSNAWDDKGFSVGAGARYTFAPIIMLEEGGSTPRGWLTPLARLSYKWLRDNDDLAAANLTLGTRKRVYYTDYSSSLSGQRKSISSGFCFLFTFSKRL
jgi:hypothetical protein